MWEYRDPDTALHLTGVDFVGRERKRIIEQPPLLVVVVWHGDDDDHDY